MILLIEDNKAHSELIKAYFEREGSGIPLHTCSTLKAANTFLEEASPDVLISDYKLPDGTGLDLINAEKYPLILMTAFGDEEIAVEAMKTGAAEYIIKSEHTFTTLPVVASKVLQDWKQKQDKKRFSKAILESEQRFQILVNSINEVFWFSTVGVTELVYVSPAFERIWGMTLQDLYDTPKLFIDAIHPEDKEAYFKVLDTYHAKGKEYECCYRIYNKDGDIRWIDERGYPVENYKQAIVYMAGTCTDITKQKENEDKLRENEARLEYLAYHDSLTGMPNRLFFYSQLRSSLARSKRNNTKFAVLLIDLDRFKVINDSMGHGVGDHFLKIISKRLLTCIRGSDTATRVGGDEFAVIMDDIDKRTSVASMVKKILTTISLPTTIQNKVLYSTASIGISIHPQDGSTPDVLLKAADIAMYRAKNMGKNTFSFYRSHESDRAFDLLALEMDMPKAIESREFFLEYQPQFELDTGKVVGVEALLRWNHPERGIISPDVFIPIAEETGLILPLGHWVLQESIKQYKCWKNKGVQLDKISVNLSALQFRQPDLLTYIYDSFKAHNLEAQCLELEITESLIMSDIENTVKCLKDLKSMGLSLSIDDFGTGYSSLSYLKRFAIDKLKIDRSFVKDIETDPNDAAISASIIALAHKMNLKVIAEGVENEQQAAFLKSQQCDEVQGFLYGTPMSKENIEACLCEHS